MPEVDEILQIAGLSNVREVRQVESLPGSRVYEVRLRDDSVVWVKQCAPTEDGEREGQFNKYLANRLSDVAARCLFADRYDGHWWIVTEHLTKVETPTDLTRRELFTTLGRLHDHRDIAVRENAPVYSWMVDFRREGLVNAISKVEKLAASYLTKGQRILLQRLYNQCDESFDTTTAIVHWDAGFHNFGLRSDGSGAFFDWQTVGVGPRELDLATLAQGPDGNVSDLVSEYLTVAPTSGVSEQRLRTCLALVPIYRLGMEIQRAESLNQDIGKMSWWPNVVRNQIAQSEEWAS